MGGKIVIVCRSVISILVFGVVVPIKPTFLPCGSGLFPAIKLTLYNNALQHDCNIECAPAWYCKSIWIMRIALIDVSLSENIPYYAHAHLPVKCNLPLFADSGDSGIRIETGMANKIIMFVWCVHQTCCFVYVGGGGSDAMFEPVSFQSHYHLVVELVGPCTATSYKMQSSAHTHTYSTLKIVPLSHNTCIKCLFNFA